MTPMRLENARMFCNEIREKGDYCFDMKIQSNRNFGRTYSITFNGKPCYSFYEYAPNRLLRTLCQALQFLADGLIDLKDTTLDRVVKHLLDSGWELEQIKVGQSIIHYRIRRIK